MRRIAVLSSALVIASCGATPPAAGPIAPAVVVAAPLVSAVLLAAIVSALGSPERMMLARFLPEAGRALTSPHAASALGIDPHRPLRFGLALTQQGRARASRPRTATHSW